MTDPTRQQFERNVLPRLRRLGRRLRWYVVLDGLPLILLLVVIFVAGSYVVDRTVGLTREMRVVQLTSLLVAVAVAAWLLLLRPLRVAITPAQLAILLEDRFPQLCSRLITAVELVNAPAGRRSPAMVAAVVREAEGEAAGLPMADIFQLRRVRQRGAIALGCALLLSLAGAAWQDAAWMWLQRNILLRDVDWPLRNRLIVEGLTDGRMLVPRGDDVTVSAAVAPGFEAPRQVYIDYQGREGLRGRDQMPAMQGDVMPARTHVGMAPGTSERTDAGTTTGVLSPRPSTLRFTHTFERLSETVRCSIFGGDARTEPFTIEVIDRPRVEEVTIGVSPPAYTRSEEYELRAGQTVAEVLNGSRIRLRIRTNKPLAEARLVRQTIGREKEVATAERQGERLYWASDQPDATGTYYFRMLDTVGLSNISERTPPVRVSVRLVPDKPPKVTLRARGVGEMITPEAVLPLEADFSDTYGLASARLVYELARKDFAPAPETIPAFGAGTKTFAHLVDWAAMAHGLVEGDRLSLRAEASDFDDISGPNVGRSPTVSLRVVSREELTAELNRRQQEYRQDFERLLRQQEELYSQMLTFAGQSSNSDPEQPRRIGQLARLQRDFSGRTNSLRIQFEQVLSELRVNRLATPAAETRLSGGILEPLGILARMRMPAAADDLERLAKGLDAEGLAAARVSQQVVLADMKRILSNMIQWEGFQEAIGLLREVLRMQNKVGQETEARIAAEVLGTAPASEPSK